jgi:hypothetical protein
MHTKSSNSSSPSKDPVSLKRSKQTNPKQSDSYMSVDLTSSDNDKECFWNIVKASSHPVVIAKINRMRRQDTDSKLYRVLMYEVGTFLAYEATSDLSLTEAKTVKSEGR